MHSSQQMLIAIINMTFSFWHVFVLYFLLPVDFFSLFSIISKYSIIHLWINILPSLSNWVKFQSAFWKSSLIQGKSVLDHYHFQQLLTYWSKCQPYPNVNEFREWTCEKWIIYSMVFFIFLRLSWKTWSVRKVCCAEYPH